MTRELIPRSKLIEILSERDGFLCFICKGDFGPKDEVTLDHWTPRSRGGGWEPENLRLSHKKCNALKGDTMPDDENTVTLTHRVNTFRSKAVKRSERPDICQRCENGRSLAEDEYCNLCGSVPMPFKHPRWAKLTPNECDHSGVWWCWCCMSGIVDRVPAIYDVLRSDDDSEFDV